MPFEPLSLGIDDASDLLMGVEGSYPFRSVVNLPGTNYTTAMPTNAFRRPGISRPDLGCPELHSWSHFSARPPLPVNCD